MRICFFGTYTLEEGYPVNRVVLQGLKAAGAEVVECHANLWPQPHKRWSSRTWFLSPSFWYNTIKTYIRLIFNYYRIGSYDLMVVGYLGHLDIFLARLLNLFKSKPLVLIAFNSLYETVVQDRKLFSPWHPIALFLRWLDRAVCRLADLVLLDTQAHIEYFIREFNLPASKFIRVFVGSVIRGLSLPESVQAQHRSNFEVFFVGTYIPLHGIETIIRAAKLLENEPDIRIILVGQGQLYPAMHEVAKQLGVQNVKFIGRWVASGELIEYLSEADVCLGIFGKGEKAQRVIPCKVFDALAISKPLITADTTAVRELLTEGEDALFCPAGDARALATAILQLKRDPALKERIGRKGHETYSRTCSPEAIGNLLAQAFGKLAQRSPHP
jgi:glycosyltransferase involved in cell wall biosynthesis